MFLLPSINLQLRPTLLNLKPGTRIVSNTFTMEDWEADETASVGHARCQSWCNAFLWIIPAKVQGTWKTPQGELNLTQSFQMITGTLGSTPVKGKMLGDQISFNAGSTQYTGRVNGSTIQGTNFTATRYSSQQEKHDDQPGRFVLLYVRAGRMHTVNVVVVGAGHNGLVAALLLARSGLDVLVLEAQRVVGGAARSERPFAKAPHLTVSTGAYLLGLMPPELLQITGVDLPLKRRDPHYFLPRRDRGYLLFGSDEAATKRQFLPSSPNAIGAPTKR